MKKLLFLLYSLSYGFLMAQDCTSHALMQKGVQLEYKEYWVTPSRKIPVARLLFTADQVTDSAGSTWSSITKSVFSNIDPNDHYERKLVLQCDGKNLLFPYDLYYTDTIYRRDFYPEARSGDYSYAVVYLPLKDAITYIVPLTMDCIVSLPEGRKQVDLLAKAGYLNFNLCTIRKFNVESVRINRIILEGREIVTTAAGNFDCYKFCMELIENGSDTAQFTLYYNKEAGFVKLEDYRRYVELISIMK
jgi:hypothetical protein